MGRKLGAGSPSAIIPIDQSKVQEYHAKMRRELATWRESVDFRLRLNRCKQNLSKGMNLTEIQDRLEMDKPDLKQEWEVLKYALYLSYFSFESSALEMMAKQKHRYAEARRVLSDSKAIKDLPMQLASIRTMAELDKADIELKKLFGVMKIHIDPMNEMQAEQNEVSLDDPAKLESAKLIEALKLVRVPVPASSLAQDDHRGEESKLVTITVDAHDLDGSKS